MAFMTRFGKSDTYIPINFSIFNSPNTTKVEYPQPNALVNKYLMARKREDINQKSEDGMGVSHLYLAVRYGGDPRLIRRLVEWTLPRSDYQELIEKAVGSGPMTGNKLFARLAIQKRYENRKVLLTIAGNLRAQEDNVFFAFFPIASRLFERVTNQISNVRADDYCIGTGGGVLSPTHFRNGKIQTT